ncbi:hypothetical protein Dda_0476 [Drechslerella dactyloides]|uniref:thioredoxin-dependent peroxiredoxin n=1 Tax=Drechslerella dactyloides TaxID=74499 RepID=A0AAD6J7X6_DREDA|nr:hypothetical protein Dda_0476 [Drechslerella dactyloides]
MTPLRHPAVPVATEKERKNRSAAAGRSLHRVANMPMELRKRKAPAAPPPPPPAPKRKATAPKKDKKPAAAAAAEKVVEKAAEKATLVKKVAAPKKTKAAAAAEKAEVTTDAPTADPEVLPEAPAVEEPAAAAPSSSKAKAAPKGKAAKEKESNPAPKTAEPKKEEPKEKKAAPKDKKENAAAVEKPAPKAAAKKDKATAEEKKPEPAAEKAEKKEKEKEKKPASTAKASTSKSATATPAPSAAVELKAGDPIPTGLPELLNHAGEKVMLSALIEASKNGIVLFAYPQASTPGCIKQANAFNAAKDGFEAEGFSIYGISGDKPEKNLKFKEKEKLTYPLLSDTAYDLHARFGIAKPGGKGTLRSVVVISKDGKVVAIKKAGPEETVKAARAACGVLDGKADADKDKKEAPAASSSSSAAAAAAAAVVAADTDSKQPTVEEAPDAST